MLPIRPLGLAALIGFTTGLLVARVIFVGDWSLGSVYDESLSAGYSSATGCNTKPCSPCEPKLAGQSCKWKFVKYTPSAFELRWLARMKEEKRVGEHPCDYMDTEFLDEFRTYLDTCAVFGYCAYNLNEFSAGGCNCTGSEKPKTFDPRVFSSFEYINECTQEVIHSYIEPLVGIMRHPKYCPLPAIPEHERVKGNHLDFLVLEQWEVHKSRNPNSRTFYFDLGASAWVKNDTKEMVMQP
eukprot:3267900-Amphidinium_carterae.1